MPRAYTKDGKCPRCKVAEKYGKNGYCRSCFNAKRRELIAKKPEQYKESKLANFYGVSREEVRRLRAKKSCDVCLSPCNPVCIDHNHKTGKVRGTLCHRCNLFLGKLEAHRPNLARFLQYLN